MLILAGVTINLTLGENGIFTTAQKAAQNYTQAQNQELLQLSDFTDGLTVGKVARIKDGVQYIGDGAGSLIPVPVGFSYLEGTKNTGFVIKNDEDGNEFVWIPVGDVANYKRVGWSRDNWDYSQTLNELTGEITRKDKGATVVWTEEMPIDERESISIYEGFYIGRYEAGIAGGTKGETLINGTYYTGDNKKLVVQDDQQVWNYVTKDRALEEATCLYNKTDDNVTSKLCSSYGWDSALKFIETKNSIYPTNSTGGNYTAATGGTGDLQRTGFHEVNNIYDMGGNAWEWTTEFSSESNKSGVIRGGNFTDSAEAGSAAGRDRSNDGNAFRNISFRVALFM